MVRRIGFRASASRIRTGFARLPACSPARYGRSASASRSRLDRGSNPCMVAIKEKPPFPEASSSSGAAYRIRTYDVLIRSQTLYPAEVTPRLVDYYAQGLNNGQAFFQKKVIEFDFYSFGTLGAIFDASRYKKSPRCRELQDQLVRRIGFRASAARIRTGFARLPARSPARYGRSASASRSRLDRGSNLRNAPI